MGDVEMMQQFSMHYIVFYDRISLGCCAQGREGPTNKAGSVFKKKF